MQNTQITPSHPTAAGNQNPGCNGEKQPESHQFTLFLIPLPPPEPAKTVKIRELYKIFRFPQEVKPVGACGEDPVKKVWIAIRTVFPQPFGNPCGKPPLPISHSHFSVHCLSPQPFFATVPQYFHRKSTYLFGYLCEFHRLLKTHVENLCKTSIHGGKWIGFLWKSTDSPVMLRKRHPYKPKHASVQKFLPSFFQKASPFSLQTHPPRLTSLIISATAASKRVLVVSSLSTMEMLE